VTQDFAIAYFLTLIVLVHQSWLVFDATDECIEPRMLKSPHSNSATVNMEIVTSTTGC
jgi:hypothetical protein